MDVRKLIPANLAQSTHLFPNSVDSFCPSVCTITMSHTYRQYQISDACPSTLSDDPSCLDQQDLGFPCESFHSGRQTPGNRIQELPNKRRHIFTLSSLSHIEALQESTRRSGSSGNFAAPNFFSNSGVGSISISQWFKIESGCRQKL